MKNLKIYLYVSLLCAALLASCEKGSIPEPQDPDNNPSESTAPVINSYSTKFDNKAVYDEKLVIVGENFAETKSDNIVMFDSTKASVLTASPTELTVKIPRINKAHAVLSVEVGGQVSNKRAIYYDAVRCDSVLLFQTAKVERIREGVEWKQLETTWRGAPRSINVVCITPSTQNKLGLALPSALATTSATSKAEDALVAINASYFSSTSTGFVRINGVDKCAGNTYSDSDYYKNNGVFVFSDNLPNIKEVKNNAAAAKLPDQNIQCCGPLLAIDSNDIKQENVSHCTTAHPRTVIGVTDDGRVLFVVVDGRFEGKAEGMSTTMLQELMRLLGAKHALNLDGGGSSTMYIKDKGVVNHVCNSGSSWDKVVERKVASIIYVK